MGLIAEHDGTLHGYETVQLRAAGEPGDSSAAMLRRRSGRITKRAVLYLHCLADSVVPDDLASWYTERGFHFYVADLRPQAQPDKPAVRRRSPADLSDCFKALDAMAAHLRESVAIDTLVVSAHAAGALIAALWCDARRESGPADALILAGPAFGSGRQQRISRRLRKAGPAAAAVPERMLAGAQRQLRSGLDIACPVLVMCTAADWDAPPDGRRRKDINRQGGGHGTTRLGPHVTWLRLADELTGPLPPGGPEGTPFFRELGRWLGAYLSGQFRDQLL
jgi:alpha-beta hydrolase superfamily lysophospholipase